MERAELKSAIAELLLEKDLDKVLGATLLKSDFMRVSSSIDT